MTFQIGDVAPDFRARSTHGDIQFYDWLDGGWSVLLTYAGPLTADAVEEVRAVDAHRADLERIGVKVLAVVTGRAGDFADWTDALSVEVGRTPSFPFVPIVETDMPEQGGADGVAARTLRVIGPDKRVKLAMANPVVTLTRFGEILRLIESLQYAGARRMAKPSADGLIVLPCAPSPGQAKEQPPRKRCG